MADQELQGEDSCLKMAQSASFLSTDRQHRCLQKKDDPSSHHHNDCNKGSLNILFRFLLILMYDA